MDGMDNPKRIEKILNAVKRLVKQDLIDAYERGDVPVASVPFRRSVLLPDSIGLKLWFRFLLLSKRDRRTLLHRLKKEPCIVEHPCSFRNNRITLHVFVYFSMFTVITYKTEFKEFR